MKRSVAALVFVSFLLAAPAAGAEVIQTVDTISVVGIGRVVISPVAAAPEADSVYHQALSQAVGDGLAKARLLAEATGAKVGPVEAISERGDKEIECKTATGEFASYKGAKPDSGSAEAPTLAVKPAIAAQPPKRAPSKKKKPRRPTTKRAFRRVVARVAENVPASCELSTEVSLIYDLELP